MINKLAITAVLLCALAVPVFAEPAADTAAADQPKTTSAEVNSNTDTDGETPELVVELGIPDKSKESVPKPAATKPAVKKSSASTSTSIDKEIAQANRFSRLTREALSCRGLPYIWGGGSRTGFDCSGFTQYLYQKRGIKLPHSAKLQFKMGIPVNKSDLKECDLVFFNTRGPITHVGMYIGDGKFIHAANPRRGVVINSLDDAYYTRCYAGARRYT
ncbi:MAG: C40 family peptidase [Armatimonadota bacterium]